MDFNKRDDTSIAYGRMLLDHQGGGFVVLPTGIPLELPSVLDQVAVMPIPGLKPFIVSIYNQYQDIDIVSLTFMINPKDISIGQTFIAQDAYTREGWLSSLWGKGQPTIQASGSTSAFYLNGDGLVHMFRAESLAFKNFMCILAIFKNGGYYHLSGVQNLGLFKNDPGRVISVMDLIKISYDGTEYVGSFNNFTVDESVESPFKFTYTFDFVISGLRGDNVEGHLKICKDGVCNDIDYIDVQTAGNYKYTDIISIDPDAEDIRPPVNISSASSTGPTGTGMSEEKNNAANSGSKVSLPGVRYTIPADARRDAVKLLEALNSNKDIEVASRLNTPEKVCARRKVVNDFIDKNNIAPIYNKCVAAFGKSSNLKYSDSINIMCIEGALNGERSPAGALGQTQIMPKTYNAMISKLEKDPAAKKKYDAFMNSCGFSNTSSNAALGEYEGQSKLYNGVSYPLYKNGLLGTNPQFNLAVHFYLMQTEFNAQVSGPNAIANSTDPAGRLAAVGIGYNGGPGVFRSSSNTYIMASEAAVYGKTFGFMAGITCQ